MDLDTATALYRAHATARLRGDTAEARRLVDRMGTAESMAHMLFVTHLLAQVVFDEYGTRPDPTDLAEITKRLHDKHYPVNGSFVALRAEAIVRAICGETHWLAEIPFGEQPGYMWAVMNELVDPGITDDELAERFAVAEEIGGAWPMKTLTNLLADDPSDADGEELRQERETETPPGEAEEDSATEPKPEPELNRDTGPKPDPDPNPTTGPSPDAEPHTCTAPTDDEERTA